MSSGNPFGLSEISHYGSFQRVGGKAGGFINKKFFHPSSLRNQEKLWKAQTANERETRKQAELEKQREEERKVDDLKKQMYLAGQGKAGDMFSAAAVAAERADGKIGGREKNEQRQLIEEQKKRRAQLRRAQAQRDATAGEEDEEGESSDDEEGANAAAAAAPAQRPLAKSGFAEDVFVLGHTSVWGSWYSTDDSKWGFQCCRKKSREADCPNAAEAAGSAAAADEAPGRRKKRRKAETDGAGDGSARQADGAGVAARREVDDASLLDTRLVEAAERRRREQRIQETSQVAAKKAPEASSYLANLLQDPSSGV